jgi:hypothetical protein
MSSPQPAPQDDPKAALRKQFVSALVWTILAAVLAVYLFVQASRPDNDKKNFYILAGVVAVIAAAANGYAAWNAHRQSKTPPTSGT